MKYELIIFDMDGTILDTLEDLTDSMNYALQEAGQPVRTIDEICTFVGNGLRNLVHRAVAEGPSLEEEERIFKIHGAYYREHSNVKTKPYDGIIDLLKQLKVQGYKLAVVSNKADAAVKPLCDMYFKDLFDVALGEREGVNKKPAPDAVYEVLKELGIEKEKSLYIGDSEVDVATARNAEVDLIAVSWGFRPRTLLEELQVEKIADSVEELMGML